MGKHPCIHARVDIPRGTERSFGVLRTGRWGVRRGCQVMGSGQICIHICICMQIYIKICMHTPRVHHSKQNHTRLKAWGGVGWKMSSLQLHSHISMASGDANQKPTDPGNMATLSTELMTEQYRSFGTKNGQESGCYSGQEKELEESNIGLTISPVLT